jgi:hypothetical protein
MDPYRRYNSIVQGLLMYRLMMAPRAETCSDIVRPINSVMHSEMSASCLVYCCLTGKNETHMKYSTNTQQDAFLKD